MLIAVHEWGHYRMAIACGVKVLRFSVGFGPTVLRHVSARSGIEYVLALFPLGGYVRMLDEREGEVVKAERHLAFNTQSLGKRALIVVAGPLANLILAAALYSAVNWVGTEQAAPLLSTPPPDSLALSAGLVGGERVLAAGLDGQTPEPVQSFEDVRWWITKAALADADLLLQVQMGEADSSVARLLRTSSVDTSEVGPATFLKVGITAPRSSAVIGDLAPNEVAAQSGLQSGDLVLRVDGVAVPDAVALRTTIRLAGLSGKPPLQRWVIEREGQELELAVTPRVVLEGGSTIGRIGAAIGGPIERVTVRHGLLDGAQLAVERVWEVGALSLRMLGRMVIGEASLKNISGPVSIAEYAGKSASAGFTHYLLFLALISVSLGVLNLLPIPVLDGGHLMYYLWEWLTGSPPTEKWMDGLQRTGVVMLATMMGVAMWNDVSRLIF